MPFKLRDHSLVTSTVAVNSTVKPVLNRQLKNLTKLSI